MKYYPALKRNEMLIKVQLYLVEFAKHYTKYEKLDTNGHILYDSIYNKYPG